MGRRLCCFFFFQAEDGIRDIGVTGVQTCALPILRQQDHFAALAGYFDDGRRYPFQPGGVGDAAVLHRHIEIDAHQHALALHVDVIEGAELLRHFELLSRALRSAKRCAAEPGSMLVLVPAQRSSVKNAAPRPGHETQSNFPIATAVSAMRLEKPHSLSYHAITRTSVPFCTLVWSMWKVAECGSWLKSIETLGAVV